MRNDVQRFSQLQAEIPNVKQGPLALQRKQLAQAGLVHRKSYHEVPPRVEYSLTGKGKAFMNVMREMDKWARSNLFT